MVFFALCTHTAYLNPFSQVQRPYLSLFLFGLPMHSPFTISLKKLGGKSVTSQLIYALYPSTLNKALGKQINYKVQ